MLDKSWITLPRSTPEYTSGLNYFLDFAFRRSSVEGKICCPCQKCKFRSWQTREEVFNHCLQKPFPRYYVRWTFHGEGENYENVGELEVGSSSQVGMQVGGNSPNVVVQANPMVNNNLLEAFGVQETIDDGDEDEGVEGPVAEYLRNEAAKDFFELMTETDKPLYPGITLFSINSLLSIMLALIYIYLCF